eukprot:TRINITY_DN10478_c0_g1_i1.p1 TRINITY_DN10478_c0_g1~~TRINITY_DN10478_c0_g1_i1.p1  ORF type:complete len:591 (-),score=154.96 TRINITY_DN10478_c0_g1_i1:102-1874(-)
MEINHREEAADYIVNVFKKSDRQGKGTISRTQLATLIMRVTAGMPITERQVQDVLAERWQTEQHIHYEEFVNWMVLEAQDALYLQKLSEGMPDLEYDKRHLVINMDINKTIIMADTVSGKTVEATMNELVSGASWGMEQEGLWVLCSEELMTHRPRRQDPDIEMLSYSEWLERVHPGKDNRKKRNKLKCSFTEPGQPGERMAAHVPVLLEQLRQPDGSYVRVIPQFFELLKTLKEEKRSFSLCFRTFGEDLFDVAGELNAFCEGRHPLYPSVRMDGSDGQPDYRLHREDPSSYGSFHISPDGYTSLILGTIEQPGEGEYRKVADKSITFYDGFPGVHKIISGFDAVRDFLVEKTSECRTCGFRDYFAYWQQHDNTADGGKMFLFNPRRSTKRHEVFFDDNIRFSDAHIVRPINLQAPDRKVWVTPLLRKHLCRVEAIECIYDKHYFVKHLQTLEEIYEIGLRARERFQGSWQKVTRTRLHSQSCSIGATDELGDHPGEDENDPFDGIESIYNGLQTPGSESDGHDVWENMRPSDYDISIDPDVDYAERMHSMTSVASTSTGGRKSGRTASSPARRDTSSGGSPAVPRIAE